LDSNQRPLPCQGRELDIYGCLWMIFPLCSYRKLSINVHGLSYNVFILFTYSFMAIFSKVSERDKLKPRRDPYWQKLSKGCYLGFRKMTAGASGTWIARFLDTLNGKQVYNRLMMSATCQIINGMTLRKKHRRLGSST
jgi:hypothetical protein